MSEKGPKIEYQGFGETKGERENKDIHELQEFTQKVAESARAEGVPVNDDCRIDMNAFEDLECDMKGIYSRERIERDQKLADKIINIDGHLEPEEKLKNSGEKLETLKTCIFHKFLKNDFIVVRSSEYDDVNNGIDNIVLEKKTGKILCAIDEVADNSGHVFRKKQEKIAEENLRNGGTFVKYGLDIENGKVILAPRMNVPIFYLALSKNQVEKGVKDFKISGEKSDTEKAYYKEFISSMLEQTSLMSSEYENSNINKNLKENINYFYNILEKIQNQK
jgi:hypothetical protein